MSDPPNEKKSPEDLEIEREARVSRDFTLFDAIGRSAAGLLKGTSPVTRKRQAEAAVKALLEDHLRDAEGALAIVLLRRVSGSEELLAGYDDAGAVLEAVIEGLLVSETKLAEFVSRVDSEWGRIYLEHPHFERPEQPPDPDDPYTLEGVRHRLVAMLESLRR